MQRDHVVEGFGPRSSLRGRSSSLSIDPRQTPKTNLLSPPLVNPQPQYIAAAPARQLISADQGSSASRTTYANVDITDAALALLNGFLDNLLFSILLTAKSTKLIAIRPAVSEVLRPRLAREVVSAADDELGEYMGGSDDDEFSGFHGGQEQSGHFELERSWKLTRLRCMVYSRLGDMEEEDEEDYLRQEGLEDTGPGRFSRQIGHITPAAAIFLTSILEHIGENALVIVTDIARTRLGFGTAKSSEEQPEKLEEPRPLVIDDIDVEKIALNSTLGRLWRTWRKRSRVPALSRTLSRESILRFPPRKTSSRQSSVGTVETVDEPQFRTMTSPPPVSEDAEKIDPADVPLPLSDNDIDEIETPGFTAKLAVAVQARSLRPRSLFITNPELTAPAPPEHPLPKSASALEYRTHARSYSLPTTPLKATAHRTPELVIIPPKPEEGQLEPMCEDIIEPARLTRKRSHTLDNDRTQPERRDSMEPDPYLDTTTHDGPGSPVSSLHSDAIGVAIGHTDMTEAPSPISRGGSRFSSGSSEYEDCEQRVVVTPTFSAKQIEVPETRQFDEDEESHKAPAIHSSMQQRPTLDVYTNIPSPIPPRSPRRVHHNGQELSPPPNANDTIVETAFVSQPTSKSVSQPPRLSPLRELVAAASSTPEEHSPILPSVAESAESPEPKSALGHSERSARSQTRRIQVKTQMVNNGTTTTTTHTATSSPRSVSPGRERAAVQRVSPPPSKSPSEGYRSRRSESNSSFPDRRPITAGSGTSQVSSKLKGLVGRQGTSASMRSGDGMNGDTASDLDQLIESDETLHYTLTPRTMREIEDPGSPRWTSVRKDGKLDPEDSGSVAASEATSRALQTLTPISNGSNNNNTNTNNHYNNDNGLRISTPTLGQPKRPSPEPRDAKADVTSVREFANFIRYTGPDPIAPKTHTPIITAAAQVRQTKLSYDLGSLASASSSPAPSSAQSSMSGFLSKPHRPRLEARSAVTPKNTQTSELIDFIREGPPRDGLHRIPRTVAPFRTTMDSDEFHSLSPTRMERDRDAPTLSSIASTQDGSTVARSINSSFNSRTGLLESAKQPINIRPVRNQSQLGVLDSPGFEHREPVRTRRRIRDPYAIDSDSEDELSAQPKRPQREEESLVDFLRSVPPPSNNNDVPQLLSVNMHPAAVKPRSKSTASLMKSRLMRSASIDKTPKNKLSKSSLRSHKSFATSPTGTTTPADAPALPLLHTTSSSISSQTLPWHGQGQESYTPTSSTYANHVNQLRNGYNMSPRPTASATATDGMRKNSYARPVAGAGGDSSGTAALADFFRNTAPPPEPPVSRVVTPTVKEGGTLARMFMRRKKQVA